MEKNKMLSQKHHEETLKILSQLEHELIQITQKLIQIPSVNPTWPGLEGKFLGFETEVNEFIANIYDRHGIEYDLWEEEKKRANLVGIIRGDGQGKSLILNGHVDVVPPGPASQWKKSTPWSGEIIGSKIYGRGASDMKAGIAAAIIAMKAIKNLSVKLSGDLIIETVVGEEMKNFDAGIGSAIKKGYIADAAIVLEASAPPFPLAILPVSAGLLGLTIKVKGKLSHSAMRYEMLLPKGAGNQVAVSSIDKAYLIYKGLRNLETKWKSSKLHELFFKNKHFTIAPINFHGGYSGLDISNEGYFIMDYEIWYPPGDSAEKVQQEIKVVIYDICKSDEFLKNNLPELDWAYVWPAFETDSNSAICELAKNVYFNIFRQSPILYGFSAVSDGTFLNQAGVDTIILGPGNLQVAHAPDEYVEINEIINAAKMYALIALNWCY